MGVVMDMVVMVVPEKSLTYYFTTCTIDINNSQQLGFNEDVYERGYASFYDICCLALLHVLLQKRYGHHLYFFKGHRAINYCQ